MLTFLNKTIYRDPTYYKIYIMKINIFINNDCLKYYNYKDIKKK